MPHLVFVGYFGCGNLGDDAILLGFLNHLEKTSKGFEYTIFCDVPEYLRRQYNLHGVARKDRKATLAAIQTCDAVVFPGGSIFQDVTSVRSVAYYADVVKRAKKAGKKVFLLNQGVGPLNSFFGKRMAGEAFRSADFISVRDPNSQSLLQSIGVTNKMLVAADSAFLLPEPPREGEEDQFGIAGRKTVALIPRPFGDEKKLAKEFADLCKILASKHISVTLIEMDEKVDGPFIDLIERSAGGRLSHIKKAGSPIKIQQRLRRMDGVISLRLHGAILAASVGIAPFVLSYDPKTLAIAKLLDLPTPMGVETVSAERIATSFLAHQEKRELHDRLVSKRVKSLTELASKSIELVIRTFSTTIPL